MNSFCLISPCIKCIKIYAKLKLFGLIILCRSEIIQHRDGDKEGNNNRRRDTIRRTGECIQGEKCTTMAIYNIFILISSIIVVVFYSSISAVDIIMSYLYKKMFDQQKLIYLNQF